MTNTLTVANGSTGAITITFPDEMWTTNVITNLYVENGFITNDSLGRLGVYVPPKTSFLMQPPNRIDCMIVTLAFLLLFFLRFWRASK